MTIALAEAPVDFASDNTEQPTLPDELPQPTHCSPEAQRYHSDRIPEYVGTIATLAAVSKAEKAPATQVVVMGTAMQRVPHHLNELLAYDAGEGQEVYRWLVDAKTLRGLRGES